MVDLSTKYMGLDLKNPIIIGSCGLVNSVEKIKKLEKNGAAAVVLKSLFEEQILSEIDSLSGDSNYSEGQEYLSYFTKDYNISKHLDLIRDAKKEISIPIIASINCSNADGWTDYAKKIEDAGADALELNVFILPTDANSSSEEIEKLYFDIVKNVNKEISIPFSIKIGSYFSSLAKTVVKLSKTDLAGIVMFNRFYNPDIDLETLEIKPSNVFSNPSDLFNTLRWIALLSDKVDCDLIATNGIHDGAGVIKSILTGAKAVEVVSAIYQKGPEIIEKMLNDIDTWTEKNNYRSINDFRGKLSSSKHGNSLMFERTQFMKYYGTYK
jgi:dihydroorotate dehydrogenase (fumarate)